MTDDRFCELETAFTGETIDDIEQLTRACFTGIELKEYVEFFIGEETNKLRDALERIRPWISRITDGILADWQEELCWDIDLVCEEALKETK